VTPTVKVNAELIQQMHKQNAEDIDELKKRAAKHDDILNEIKVTLTRVDSKLDRALDLETSVVELRSDVDKARGMGILGMFVLGTVEAVTGVYALFSGKR
jgi:hypothetical protein